MIHASVQDLDSIIGDSSAIQQIRELIHQVAPTEATVLIKGNAGSGKSLIAQHIHQRSNRSDKAFITFNFSSIKETAQLDSLFGDSNTPGKWLLAKGGSIFFKEISLMNSAVQERLLNTLKQQSEKEVRILSSSRESIFPSDFNQELYYRLNTIEVNSPRLSNRTEDIPELFDYFLEHFKSLYRKTNSSVAPLVIEQLKQYEWPGNVRELKRAIERVVVIGTSKIEMKDIIPSFSTHIIREDKLKLDELEERHIRMILTINTSNIQKSAAELGISRAALYRRIEKYEIIL
ncbi:MAG: sigma-54-dependent Fis family transcriptional regulator [Flavobacteriales bacterium]|nr:sigma-54-dependent Fis family transcriptional regulator [Flavobacteriales bacterium]